MSYPVVYTWPAPDTQAICLTQSRTGAGALVINGNLTVNISQPGNAIFPGISRVVSLTSANNLGAVNFTITGILNGASVTETRVGPNANTVQTTQLFDQVTSVTTSATVTDVSLGSGTTGRTHWFLFDYNRDISALTIQAIVTGTINYTTNATLDDVQTVASPTVFAVDASLTGATTNILYKGGISLYNYINTTINSSTNGTLTVTMLQSGMNS